MIERQERRRNRDFSVPGVVFVLFWFIWVFFVVVLAFV